MEDFYRNYPSYEMDTGNKNEFGENIILRIIPFTLLGENEIVSTHTVVIADQDMEADTAYVIPSVVGDKIIWDIDLHTGDVITADNYLDILPEIKTFFEKNCPECLLEI